MNDAIERFARTRLVEYLVVALVLAAGLYVSLRSFG
jgi:hypothetical protein